MVRLTILSGFSLIAAACTTSGDQARSHADATSADAPVVMPDPETQPRAIIRTSAGDIIVELAEDAAPITVANFIAHAEAGHYDDGSFYRSVREDNERAGVDPMSLIQGGHVFSGYPDAEPIAHESTLETGLTHQRGAISMGRFDPGTATSEFFIMVHDYPGLDAGPGGRNPDEQGYAVFGQVVEGMEVVETIWMSPTSVALAPEDFAFPQFIDDPVVIETVVIED